MNGEVNYQESQRLMREVENELGYKIDAPMWQTPVIWGVIAFGVLLLGSLIAAITGEVSYSNDQEWPSYYGATAIIAGFAGYLFERGRHKKWWSCYDARLEDFRRKRR